jgi:glycerol-3-phosphate acyltransferase PlsY
MDAMPGLAQDALVVLIAYVIGAVPFSYIMSHLGAGINIREHGEGNVGARNVYHVVGHRWGAAAALLDVAKGIAVFFVADRFAATTLAFLLCGVAVAMGHNFSVFLGFRGGKGLSVVFGFLLSYLPAPTLAGMLVIIGAYFVTRDINKALVFGIPLMVLLPPLFGAPWWTVPYAVALFLLCAWKKIVDRAHEQEVWSRRPWAEGTPGFHEDSPGAEGTGTEATRP